MRPEYVIRALGPQDACAVQDFVRRLSMRTRRERYFSAISELTPRQLERTTRPRAPADLSLGAFEAGAVVGLAECAGGEFGIVIADAWQGQGLGRALMERLLAHACEARLPALRGLVRAGNRAMLGLAARLGFRAVRDEDADYLRLEQWLQENCSDPIFRLGTAVA